MEQDQRMRQLQWWELIFIQNLNKCIVLDDSNKQEEIKMCLVHHLFDSAITNSSRTDVTLDNGY